MSELSARKERGGEGMGDRVGIRIHHTTRRNQRKRSEQLHLLLGRLLPIHPPPQFFDLTAERSDLSLHVLLLFLHLQHPCLQTLYPRVNTEGEEIAEFHEEVEEGEDEGSHSDDDAASQAAAQGRRNFLRHMRRDLYALKVVLGHGPGKAEEGLSSELQPLLPFLPFLHSVVALLHFLSLLVICCLLPSRLLLLGILHILLRRPGDVPMVRA
mmetsp:Transcript_20269/g.67625  ORF Transcript_20269/g.67625 Transcript_20269/m.67625 type:complete len:212 (+) Transcript_20269:558-1193(+)